MTHSSNSNVMSFAISRITALLRADPRRDIYACEGGGYAICYGGGEISASELQEALEAGIITRKYPGKDLPVWVLKERAA